jgi:glycosyltransferase involved in cell wall biosynthesis
VRFAFVSTMARSPWGGSEELWSQAAFRLQQSGHQVRVSMQHWDSPAPQLVKLSQAGIDVDLRRDTTWAFIARGGRRLLGTTIEEIEQKTCADWLRRTRPNLCCLSSGWIAESIAWMSACRNLNLPYVLVVHVNAEQHWPDDWLASRLREAYLGARICFFVSRRNQELLEDQIGERLSNARVIRNPFNVDYDAAPAWPDEGNDWRLACVARLEPDVKGQDLLVKTLSQQKWRERPLRIMMFGNGPTGMGIRKLCTLYDVPRVEFAGCVSDVEAIWKTNHALILASRFEGLPLALVEAMLCSRMAIVTDVGGNTEVVRDGVTGFVAKAPTLSLMDEAMERAWQHRKDWKAMGELAGRTIRQIVSNDPVKEFCECLLETAAKTAVGRVVHEVNV